MSTSARPLIPIPPIPTKCTCCGLKNTSILYCFGFRAVCQEEGVSGQGSVVSATSGGPDGKGCDCSPSRDRQGAMGPGSSNRSHTLEDSQADILSRTSRSN